MPNIKDISDEELLKKRDDLNQEGPIQVAPSDMSDEELLARRTALGGESRDSVSGLESAARGVAQGVTLGFADEISGVVESVVTDKSYEDARDESRAAFERSKNANTAAYLGGEIVGGIGAGIATGGAGAGVRAAAVMGGLYSVGSSNKTGIELAQDAVIGTALGAAGEKVLRGIGGYAKKIFKNSSPKTQMVAETLSNSTDDVAASLETNWLKLAYSKGYNNADDVLTDPDWMRTVQSHVNKAPDSIHKIVNKAKDSYGHLFNDINLNNQGVTDDLLKSKMFNDLLNESKKELVGTSDASKWIAQFQADLTNGKLVGDISEGASFEQLNKIKRHLGQTLSRNKAAGEGIGEAAFNDKSGNRLLAIFVDQLDNRLGQIDTTGKFASVNQQFRLLKTAEQVIPNGGEKANVAEIMSFFTNFGQGKGVTKGSIFFEQLEQFDVANGTTYAQQVIQDVKPVVDNFMLSNMAQFSSQFDQATSLVFRGRALASINPMLAPLAMGEPVVVRLANMAGKINAKVAGNFKVPRTTQGIKANAPVISKKLSLKDPSAAIAFNEAYRIATEDGDDRPIKQMALQMASNPALASEFENGLGFDGQLTSPEEVAIVRNNIMSQPISLSAKIQAVNELDKTNSIPNIQQEPPVVDINRESLNIQRRTSEKSLNLVRKVEKEIE